MQFTKSEHYQRVEKFMQLAGQETPTRMKEPSDEVKVLRAKLIFEEAMETIAAMGIKASVKVGPEGCDGSVDLSNFCDWIFEVDDYFDMQCVIDGCCDLAVVTTGTLIACGVPDEAFQAEVDQNNLAKFGPGHQIRSDGKLIKPPNHRPPKISELMVELKKLEQGC